VTACDRVRSSAAALVLGELAGDERAALLDHLEACPDCRSIVADSGSALEALLVAAPSVDPPAGFEGRVLERIDAQPSRAVTDGNAGVAADVRTVRAAPPVSAARVVGAVDGGPDAGSTFDGARGPLDEVARARRRHRRWAVALVAAAAVIAVLIAGFALRGPGGGSSAPIASVRSAPMVAADGYRVGRSVLSSDPDTLVVAVPGWQAPGVAPVASYRVELGTRNGDVRALSGVRLRDGRWTGELPVDPNEVRWVAMVTPAGDEVCRARFGPT
jgi:hypothetical protein